MANMPSFMFCFIKYVEIYIRIIITNIYLSNLYLFQQFQPHTGRLAFTLYLCNFMAYTVTKGNQIVGFICKNSAYLEQIAKYFGNVLSTNVLLHSKDIRLLSKVSDCLGHPKASCSEPAWLGTLERCVSYHCTESQDGGLPLRRSS